MNERETFLNTWENEFQITLRVLKAYPESHAELKPAPVLRTARDLSWVFAAEQSIVMNGAVSGKLNFSGLPPTPATFKEVVANVESEYPKVRAAVSAMPEADWNKSMDWPTGPNQAVQMRRGDVLWMALHDMIHHRGQLSVYFRMSGAKLPSIYGPTAEMGGM